MRECPEGRRSGLGTGTQGDSRAGAWAEGAAGARVRAEARAAVEAEAELSAFRAAAHDRAFVALSLEVVTQALQRGHGCGWGLGDAAKAAGWAGPAAGDCAGISGPRGLQGGPR